MNKFEIINEYGYAEDYRYLKKCLKRTLKLEKVKNANFCVIFVDEAKIQDLNKNYRNIDRVTDVISFAFEDNDKNVYNKIRILGEIYICIPKMKMQAKEYGHSEVRELCFLGVHGLLHLLGYDHQNKKEEEIMFGKQEMVLNGYSKTKRRKN